MKNLTQTQHEYLDKLMQRDKDAKVRWNDKRGLASALSGKLVTQDQIMRVGPEDTAAILKYFLKAYGPLVAPESCLDSIHFVKTHGTKDGRTRIRAMQLAGTIPIHSATLLLFMDTNRGIYRVQSGCYREVEVPPLTFRRRYPVDPRRREVALRRRLTRKLQASEQGARFIKRKIKEGFGEDQIAAKNFPLTSPPVHWLFPHKEGFRHVFRFHAWQPIEWLGVNGELSADVDLVEMKVDIITGRTLYEGSRIGVWSDVMADGQSTLEENGSFITRPLLAVQEGSAERLLVNRTNTTDIFTHDASGTKTGLETKLQNGTDLSEDANGHWNDTTTSCTAADRRDSQQPETDAHFFAHQAYQYYDALGWEGFDNGEWGAAPCDVRVAAHIGIDDNAYFWRWVDGNGRHFGYLAFYDGECDSGVLAMDFMAGDPGIFAHEYQHAVTYFGSVNSNGDPGYLETTGWHRAIHEGISDSFAGLRTEIWTAPGLWPNGVCRNNKPFRRIEYPRSTATKSGNAYCDHFDDRVGAGAPYTNSTLLSHAIFLAGQGGVHERTSRSAELIPVPGAGSASIGAIVHDAVTERFDNIPANGTDFQTMIEAANLILDAAEDAPGGQRSCNYVMLRRAFYAVGLYPFDSSFTKQNYGGEACMLPWTFSWKHSRPYLGFPALWWKSPDLFINNGSGAEYDADVDSVNKLFARVRNVGDQALSNVVVRFYFRAHGTALPSSSTAWKPCQDAGGVNCVLTIPSLAAGSMNFTDATNPPADQAVNWYLPASEVVDGVDHFCIRAEIECSSADNHDNDCPYRVQSNVSFTSLSLADGLEIGFVVANWGQEPIPLDLDIDDKSLPKGVKLRFKGSGSHREIKLRPGEERPLYWKLEAPFDDKDWWRPPYDGHVSGYLLVGRFDRARFEAELSNVKISKRRRSRMASIVKLEGHLAGHLRSESRRKQRKLSGHFKGALDTSNGSLKGSWEVVEYRGRRRPIKTDLDVKATLQPTRAIHFTQRIKGEPVGGVTYALRWPRNSRNP